MSRELLRNCLLRTNMCSVHTPSCLLTSDPFTDTASPGHVLLSIQFDEKTYITPDRRNQLTAAHGFASRCMTASLNLPLVLYAPVSSPSA